MTYQQFMSYNNRFGIEISEKMDHLKHQPEDGSCTESTILYFFVYVFIQYLHVLQDSKRYMTHSTVQGQSNLSNY